MLDWSMSRLRLMRRPPDSCIARQFLKGSVTSLRMGMVVTVLSKFCTFTVCRAISITSPSASCPGTVIQSPTRTMSVDEIWMLATKDRSVSWKTRIRTAAIAPRLERRITGDRSTRIEMTMMAVTT